MGECIRECGLQTKDFNGGVSKELNGSPFAIMQSYYNRPKPGESVVSSQLRGLTTNDNNAILQDIGDAKKLLACLNVGFSIINNVQPEFLDYDQNSKYVDQTCKLVYENKRINGIDTGNADDITEPNTGYNYYFGKAKEAYYKFTKPSNHDGSRMTDLDKKITIYQATDCEMLFGVGNTEETAKRQVISNKAEAEKMKANSEIEKRSEVQNKYLEERVKEAKAKAKEEGIKDIKTIVTELDADPEILEFNILVDRLHSRELLDREMLDSIKSDPAIREFVRVLKIALPGDFRDLNNGVAQLETEMANILLAVNHHFQKSETQPLEDILKHENLSVFFKTNEGVYLKKALESLKKTIEGRKKE